MQQHADPHKQTGVAPDAMDEAVRDPVRACEDAVRECRHARHRLNALQLRKGIGYSGRSAWRAAHLRWLAKVTLVHAAQRLIPLTARARHSIISFVRKYTRGRYMSREVTENVVRLAAPGQRTTSPVVMMGQLLKLSNLVTRPFFVFLAGPFSLNHNELRVLMTLASMREAAAHEIAKAAGMHPMNVSRAVASLTRAGRISARRDVDGRRKILALTSEGLELHKALIPHVRRVAEVMCESMSSLEAEFFAKLLTKLVERLDALAPTDPMLIDAVALAQATGSRSPAIRAVPPTRIILESPPAEAKKRRSSTTSTRKPGATKRPKTESRRKISR